MLTFNGIEASLNIRGGQAQLFTLGYTGLRADRALLPGAVSKYVFNYSVHSGIIMWQGSLGPMLAGRTRLGVLQRFGTVPYAIWDASLARANGRVRPFLQLSNLTSTMYQEIPGVVMPKRSIVGGIELRLYGNH